MPKKPAGARAHDFDPRSDRKKTSFHDRHKGAPAGTRGRDERYGTRDDRPASRDGRPSQGPSKPGSRSPGHRGHRADDSASRKPRWSAQEKAGRDESRTIRSHRGQSSTSGGAPRRFDRDDRPQRFDRDDRQRSTRDDRPQRDGRDFRDDRSRGDRNDRPQRFDRNDRPQRTDRDDRPRFNRDDRPQQRFDRDARPQRDDRRFDRDSRPQRADRDNRPRFDRDSRPQRDDRPRRDFRDDRAPRAGGDRPQQRFDRDSRPQRDDRPRRDFRDDRPRRDDRSHTTRPTDHAREAQIDVVHERLEAQAVQADAVAETTFGDLGLGENIVRVLAELGAASPFPIQAATIPAIIDGRDVLGRGRTGSGKTIAFGAPLVERVLRSRAGQKREFGRSPQALILAPTRELALQLDRTIQPIARSVGLFTTQIYGGVPQARQVGALKKGVDIVVGTPGRIEDLHAQGKLDLSQVQIAVLDEGDHMCELGFLEPVQRILRLTADGSQKLLFSATLDREVAALVDEFLVDPAVHEVAGETQDSGTIDHRVLVIDQRSKGEILESLVDRDGKSLVFARTRAFADMLAEQLDDAGIPAVSLHGDLNQAKRTRNLARLDSGRVRVLVATDVAARGIHIDDIDLVVQADAPDEYKTYLHRSGRTGRAGRQGRVVTLITRQRRRKMTELLGRAEIDAPFEEARPGDDLIDELAGRTATVADLTA